MPALSRLWCCSNREEEDEVEDGVVRLAIIAALGLTKIYATQPFAAPRYAQQCRVTQGRLAPCVVVCCVSMRATPVRMHVRSLRARSSGTRLRRASRKAPGSDANHR